MSRISKSVKIIAAISVAAVGLIFTTAGIASAATPYNGGPQPYQLTSSTYKIGVDPLDYKYFTAACAAGYYFDDKMILTDGWTPNVTTQGTDIYFAAFDTTGKQIGTAANGQPEYSAYKIELGNHSWTSDHDGNFSWTCDPLPSN